jgi:cyclophilin family peptidyl-prolyl cis-trans isomerase/HEAT repeat protein
VALLRAWRLQDATLVAPVLAAAEGEDPRRRAAAAYSLMRMVGPPNTGATPVPGGTDMSAATRHRAGQVLVGLATDDDERVRELAARGLGGRSLPGAEEALLSLLSDPSWRVRVNAVRSLGRLGAGFNPESLGVALADAQVNVRVAAAQALGSMPSTPYWIQQAEALHQAPEQQVQLAAQQALATWLGVEFLPSALQLADSADASVRAAAAGMLGGIPGAAAGARLQSLLDDEAPPVANAALTALAAREGADRLELGLAVAVQAKDLTVRAAAVGLLPPDDPSVLETLEKVWKGASEDSQADVRMMVTRSLEDIPGDAATRLLRRVLVEDPDWRVRVEAASMLRTRGDDPAADAGPLETGWPAADYDRLAADSAGTQRVELVLERGRIVLELFGEDAPLTVANFTQLATSGYFDGLTFHRVVPNFVIQGGDPRGDGSGGPGHQIRCEINQRPYVRGTLGMALDGKDTGGSQFFITHTPQPHLDGGYTVFGQVVEGMDLVDQVVQGEVIREVRVLP